ncbi:MAG: tetratricopeptide repeat protein [Pirellulales bacterium]|nr:tetratricopeptide repeat protein [Pirellulales bacterium]
MRRSWLSFAVLLLGASCLGGCSTPAKTASSTDTATTKSWWNWSSTAPPPAKSEISYDVQTPADLDTLALKYNNKPGPEPYLVMAEILEKKGDSDAARAKYEQAQKANPQDTQILVKYAHFEERAGNPAKAIKLYEQAIAKKPKEARAYNDLGLCLARQGKLSEATVKLEKAVDLQPGKVLYRNNLATVYAAQNRPQDALNQLTKAHSPAVAQYNLAILLHKNNQTAAATQAMAQAVQIDPQMVAARNWLQEHAPVAGQPGQPMQANIPQNQPPAVAASPYGVPPYFPAANGQSMTPPAQSWAATPTTRGPEYTAQQPQYTAQQPQYTPVTSYPSTYGGSPNTSGNVVYPATQQPGATQPGYVQPGTISPPAGTNGQAPSAYRGLGASMEQPPMFPLSQQDGTSTQRRDDRVKMVSYQEEPGLLPGYGSTPEAIQALRPLPRGDQAPPPRY